MGRPASVAEVCAWLRRQRLGDYAPAFEERGVDGALLAGLDEDMLERDLGVASRLDRHRLLGEISRLRSPSLGSEDSLAPDVDLPRDLSRSASVSSADLPPPPPPAAQVPPLPQLSPPHKLHQQQHPSQPQSKLPTKSQPQYASGQSAQRLRRQRSMSDVVVANLNNSSGRNHQPTGGGHAEHPSGGALARSHDLRDDSQLQPQPSHCQAMSSSSSMPFRHRGGPSPELSNVPPSARGASRIPRTGVSLASSSGSSVFSHARSAGDSYDGSLNGFASNSPVDGTTRRVSCSELPHFGPGIPPSNAANPFGSSEPHEDRSSGSPEPRVLSGSSRSPYTNNLRRTDSMGSTRSSRSSAPPIQRCSSFASQVTTSSNSSRISEALSFKRLRQFCSVNNVELCMEAADAIAQLSTYELLCGLLNCSSYLCDNSASMAECQVMVLKCSENLSAQGYFNTADLLEDIDSPELDEDLLQYGLTKKRFRNALRHLLEELRTFRTVSSPMQPAASSFRSAFMSPHAARDQVLGSTGFHSLPSVRGSATSIRAPTPLGSSTSSVGTLGLRSGEEEAPFGSYGGAGASRCALRQRSISSCTIDSTSSIGSGSPPSSVHHMMSPPSQGPNSQSFRRSDRFNDSGAFQVRVPQVRSPNSNGSNNFCSHYVPNDEGQNLSDVSSHTSGDEGGGSPHSGPPRSHRFSTPTTPQSVNHHMRVHPHTDQPRPTYDRYGAGSAVPRSRQRDEVAKLREAKLASRRGGAPFDLPIVSRANRLRKRMLTEPLPHAHDSSTPRAVNVKGLGSNMRSEPSSISVRSSRGIYDENVNQENEQSRRNEGDNAAEAKGGLKYKRQASLLSVDVNGRGRVPRSPANLGAKRSGPASPPLSLHVDEDGCRSLSMTIDIPTPSDCGQSGGQPSTVRSRGRLGVDIMAIESEFDLQQSYRCLEDGALHYGNLVISTHGVKGAPGLNALHQLGINLEEPGSTKRVKMQSGLRLIGSLGKGAGGTVLKAIHVPSLRIVAVKEVVVNDRSQRKQMRRELDTLLYGLTHPNVVQFYDSFYNPQAGTTSMVFEYLRGGSLQDLIDRGTTIGSDVLDRMALHCLRGLQYLHTRSLLHRDIKPSNLLLSHDGTIKIADFGISRDLQGTEAKCSTYLGTFQYMSPERIRSQEYNFKADVWSVCLSLLTCALGRFPFKNSGYWDFKDVIMKEPFPELPERFSKDLSNVLFWGLNRDPEKRGSTTELLDMDYMQQVGKREDASARMVDPEKPGQRSPAALTQDAELKAFAELDKIAANVTGYYRDAFNATAASPTVTDTTFSVNLDIGMLDSLSRQLGLPADRVINVMDQALRRLDEELRESFH